MPKTNLPVLNSQGLNKIPCGEKGSYALLYYLENPSSLRIGRLGSFYFEPAVYVYTGSALGAGGIDARLKHHWQVAANPRWHVDFLQPEMLLLGGCCAGGNSRLECVWNQYLVSIPGTYTPVPGFGSSDCTSGCISHLTGYQAGFSIMDLTNLLQRSTPDNQVFPVSIL
jgi:Uri superfamily endonuclease